VSLPHWGREVIDKRIAPSLTPAFSFFVVLIIIPA
jgi:hypothetical protein